MATFHFSQQKKVAIWRNESFSIEADTKEEAIAKVKEAWKQCCMGTGSEDLEEVMDDARFYDSEYMYVGLYAVRGIICEWSDLVYTYTGKSQGA